MNDLGMSLIWAALQVTLLASTAMLLYAWCARRGPGQAALVTATALAAAALVSIAAFCPVPAFVTWESEGPASAKPQAVAPADVKDAEEASVPTTSETAKPASGGVGFSWSSVFLRRTWTGLERTATTSSKGGWSPAGLVGIALLAGCGLCLMRLAIGLWAVRAYRRASVPIADPTLIDLAEELRREMGCSRPIELRQAAELTSPATVGWRRPLILLPADWWGWSLAERRAVLAHEIAHVCRGDYLAGLVARISLALNFYHPLVRWLAGRLQLQQELAADALAAPFAGGADSYLQSLSRLALAQDGRSVAWPARTLLSSPGTLMRRIHMLRGRANTGNRALSRPARIGIVALIAILAIGVTALRSPAQKPSDSSETVDGKTAKVEATWPAFETAYLPDDAMGIYAVRPAAIFDRPGMKKWSDMFNEAFAHFLKEVKAPAELGVRLEDIEQVVGKVIMRTQPEAKGAQSALLTTLGMVRTVKPFDWKKQMLALVPQSTEMRHSGQVYYKCPKGVDFLGLFVSDDVCWHVPDDRTVVFEEEKSLRAILSRPEGARPACLWPEGWRNVEHDLVAVSLKAQQWAMEDKKRREPTVELAPFYEHATHLMLGASGRDDFVLHAFARCDSDENADAVAKAMEGLVTQGRTLLDLRAKEMVADAEVLLMKLGQGLLKSAKVERQGTSVSLRCEAKVDMTKLMLTLLDYQSQAGGEAPGK